MKKTLFLFAAMLLMAGIDAAAAVNIRTSKAWFESCYVEWENNAAYDSYNVYVRPAAYAEYVRLDNMLVRNYGDYGRADAVGLAAGTYYMKVIPVADDTEIMSDAAETPLLNVMAHNREGFAHLNWSEGVGAYKNDGTLKEGAKVIYVTKDNAKTISTEVKTSDSKSEVFTGLQAIIGAYEKGKDSTPIAFRIIGKLSEKDTDPLSSSDQGLQIKGKNNSCKMNITIEGIGNDATIHGFGFLIRNACSVELRNFGIMMFMDDALSFDTDNLHCWVHNIDFFYGQEGGDSDQAKGDGTVDIKGDSKYLTISYNHFWDSGKSSLCGMTSETGPNYITYHHNWFDHSDSRHPRIRTMSVHVYNNYFDGNAKYGVGATMGADVFVEKNFFNNCKYPMMTAGQGTDLYGGGTTVVKEKGTFSGEDGGNIKSFDNYFGGSYSYIPYAANSYYAKGTKTTAEEQGLDTETHYDAYEVSTRNETVPASCISLKGGNTYSNFDTDAEVMYTYSPNNVLDVPLYVSAYAGRMEKGDFSYVFIPDTEDANYNVITALKTMVENYSSTLVGFYDGENAPAPEEPVDPTDLEEPGDVDDGVWVLFFRGGVASTANYNVSGSIPKDKGSVTVYGTEYNECLKLESKSSISFILPAKATISVYLGPKSTATTIKVDGTSHTIEAKGESIQTYELEAGEHTILKGNGEAHIFYISAEFEQAQTTIERQSADVETNVCYYNLDGRSTTKNSQGCKIEVTRRNGKTSSRLIIIK